VDLFGPTAHRLTASVPLLVLALVATRCGPVILDEGPCNAPCEDAVYTACTCAANDPCSWAGDGVCDLMGCGGLSETVFDDSADCRAAVSADGDDELNDVDAEIFADRLSDLGFSVAVPDFSSNLDRLLAMLEADLEMVYHTGHGLENRVVFQTGSELACGDLMVTARNVIFASCLTLTPCWRSSFGPRAKNILGYSGLSYDNLDGRVASAFVESLSTGRSPIEAWYDANITTPELVDAWAGLVREGELIVEYSVGSGRTPRRGGHGRRNDEAMRISIDATGQVTASAEVFELVDSGFPADPPLVVLSQSVAMAEAIRPTRWSLLRSSSSTHTPMGEQQAQQLAESHLDGFVGGLPIDAEAPTVSQLRAAIDDSGEFQVVGHIVRYGRSIDEIPVRAGAQDHHIVVLVGEGGEIVSSVIHWPEARLVQPSLSGPPVLLPVEALTAAATELAKVDPAGVHIIDVRPVLGADPSASDSEEETLVPAYELLTERGRRLLIDASLGRLLP